MGTITVAATDVPGIMARMPVEVRNQKSRSGIIFRLSADKINGVLTVPDEYMTIASSPTANLTTALKEYSAQVRYNKEIAGITVSGSAVQTDRNSQNMISNAVNLLNNNTTLTEINFKNSLGAWTVIPRATMIALGVAVGTYVQQCFTTEMTIDTQIDASTITTNAQIDAFAWPNNVF